MYIQKSTLNDLKNINRISAMPIENLPSDMDSEGPDQTAVMHSLIRVFTVC